MRLGLFISDCLFDSLTIELKLNRYQSVDEVSDGTDNRWQYIKEGYPQSTATALSRTSKCFSYNNTNGMQLL